MPGSVPLYRGPFIDVPGPAVGTERFVRACDVEENARVARPERRAGKRAMQRQVFFAHLDQAGFVRCRHFFILFFATGVNQCRCFLSLPVTTSKKAFWIALVTGPALPAPISRPSSSRIGVTSAAVPVKKHSSAI